MSASKKYRMKKTEKKDRRSQRMSFLIDGVSRKWFKARGMSAMFFRREDYTWLLYDSGLFIAQSH